MTSGRMRLLQDPLAYTVTGVTTTGASRLHCSRSWASRSQGGCSSQAPASSSSDSSSASRIGDRATSSSSLPAKMLMISIATRSLKVRWKRKSSCCTTLSASLSLEATAWTAAAWLFGCLRWCCQPRTRGCGGAGAAQPRVSPPTAAKKPTGRIAWKALASGKRAYESATATSWRSVSRPTCWTAPASLIRLMKAHAVAALAATMASAKNSSTRFTLSTMAGKSVVAHTPATESQRPTKFWHSSSDIGEAPCFCISSCRTLTLTTFARTDASSSQKPRHTRPAGTAMYSLLTEAPAMPRQKMVALVYSVCENLRLFPTS
mmetsp:Transcript_43129/g.111376  ORF Transcript_43129/g.111376 Transcript_43129/m.111376 type:complete len:319 (-) Transcript_43129:658-1614(-)